jgi:transcriptional regulator with XRE-family HTH domain
MMGQTWSDRIKRLRQELRGKDGKRLSQGELADQFDLSQSQWSRIEGGLQQPPKEVEEWIEQQEKVLGIKDKALIERGGHRSPQFSYSPATFRKLWDDSSKHAKSLSLHTEITVNPHDENYADTVLTLTFEELTVPESDPLYLDCVGLLPTIKPAKSSPNILQFEKTSDVSLGKPPYAKRAIVEEDERSKLHIGPHALLYKIRFCDPYDTLTIPIIAKKAVRIDEIDAAGVPIYSDCPVECLSISLKFNGLLPTDPPVAQAYLLRRTLTESRPLSLAGGLQYRIHSRTAFMYSFENLLYPKTGYGYCIAWPSLKRT